MASESRFAVISEKWTELKESLDQQVWFQELKEKWEALDPETRLAVRIGSLAAVILIFLFSILGFIWSVHSLRASVADKQDLIMFMKNSQIEISRLQSLNAGLGSAASGSDSAAEGPWSAFFQGIAGQAGVDGSALKVGPETPGANTDSVKESLVNVSFTHVTIKQVVRFIHQVENGSRPVKLRNLDIKTQEDASGFMDAEAAFSGFTLSIK